MVFRDGHYVFHIQTPHSLFYIYKFDQLSKIQEVETVYKVYTDKTITILTEIFTSSVKTINQQIIIFNQYIQHNIYN